MISHSRILLIGLLVFSGPALAQSDSLKCNEKIRLQIRSDAKAKCSGEPKDLAWSEQELGDSWVSGASLAAFSFRCSSGKRYVGLLKVSAPGSCEVSPSQISNAALVPAKALMK